MNQKSRVADPDGTQKLLGQLLAAARRFQTAADGSVTDGLAGWLASQYMSAAHQELAGMKDPHRWEILRAFAQDWARLRHGDHTAERLRIERKRLELATEDSRQKWLQRTEVIFEQWHKEIKGNWRANRLFQQLRDELRPQWEALDQAQFQEWIKQPEILKEILPKLACDLSPETRKKVEEELAAAATAKPSA